MKKGRESQCFEAELIRLSMDLREALKEKEQSGIKNWVPGLSQLKNSDVTEKKTERMNGSYFSTL